MKFKLNDSELNIYKETLKVHTDGCFCGHAVGEVGELLGNKLYLAFYFSCRKSMNCNNPYYEITHQELCIKNVNPDNKEVVDLGSYYSEESLPENMYYPIKLKLIKKSYAECQKALKDYYVENWYSGDELDQDIPYFDV